MDGYFLLFVEEVGNKINRCWSAENVHGDCGRKSHRRSIFLMQLILISSFTSAEIDFEITKSSLFTVEKEMEGGMITFDSVDH